MSDETKPWRVKMKHGDPWIVTANNVLIASCISQHIANQIVAMANGDIRSAALEEAARVADDKEDGLVNHSKRFPTNPNIAHEYLVRAADASDIAAAIRVLKDKDTRTPTEGESI